MFYEQYALDMNLLISSNTIGNIILEKHTTATIPFIENQYHNFVFL